MDDLRVLTQASKWCMESLRPTRHVLESESAVMLVNAPFEHRKFVLFHDGTVAEEWKDEALEDMAWRMCTSAHVQETAVHARIALEEIKRKGWWRQPFKSRRIADQTHYITLLHQMIEWLRVYESVQRDMQDDDFYEEIIP